jgi:hypothetical protein
MNKYCQNPLCENEATNTVAVSTDGRSNGKRALCAACKEAYTWGLQQRRVSATGLRIEPPPKERGPQPLYRVVYTIDVNALNTQKAAENAYKIMSDPASLRPVLQVLDGKGRARAIDLAAVPSVGRTGLMLLPYSVRENLPILGSQQGKGGQAKVWVKCFIPDGSLAWYITEGSARRNPDGQAVDYLLFGLVEGQDRKLDYFWLSDLEAIRGPTGLPVERDPDWQPRTLQEIAPELFASQDKQMEGQRAQE